MHLHSFLPPDTAFVAISIPLLSDVARTVPCCSLTSLDRARGCPVVFRFGASSLDGGTSWSGSWRSSPVPCWIAPLLGRVAGSSRPHAFRSAFPGSWKVRDV